MLTKEKKIESVKEVTQKIKESSAILMVDFTGLKVDEISDLRNSLRQQGIGMRVMRKTLISRAVREAGIENFNVFQFPSSVALVFSPEEGMVVSKETYTFSKKQDKLKILGGIFSGKFTTADEIITLAKLPSKEVLLGQLVGVLKGNVKKLVVVLDQIAKVKA